MSGMAKGKTHGSKPLSKGLKPELRTLCGAFDPGAQDERYPDRIVDQVFNDKRAEIDCVHCMEQL